MVARVQLDASHVSRGVTVRREKMHRYIRNSNELLRYARLEYFFTLWEHLSTLREILHGSLSFSFSLLEFLVIPSLTWASERDRSQRRHSVFFRFLKRIEVWRTKASVVQSQSRRRYLRRGKALALWSTGRIKGHLDLHFNTS